MTMSIAAQRIDQPTLPPAGSADSLAELGPATSPAEKTSQETSPESCELGSIEPSLTDAEQKAAVDEFLKLDAEVYTKADELVGEYQALMQRFNDELLPRCDRVQAFLSQRGPMHIPGLPSWTSWRDTLLTFLQKGMKMSLATFKRRLKEYQEGDDPQEMTAGEPGEEPDEDTGTEDDPVPVGYEPPKELVTKRLMEIRTVLEKGTSPTDSNPLRDGERRIARALELLEDTQLAVDEGLFDEPTEPNAAELQYGWYYYKQGLKSRYARQANAIVHMNCTDPVAKIARSGALLACSILDAAPKNPSKRMEGVIKFAQHILKCAESVTPEDTATPATSPAEDDAPVVTHSITPRLTRRGAPAQAAETKGKDAVGYKAAYAAAIAAANAVKAETVEARFYPFLTFNKARKLKTFLQFIEHRVKREDKAEQRGDAARGVQCGEPYHTYEEALAYAMQFARDLDTQQADKFVGMYVNERTLDYGDDGREAVRRLLDMGHKAGIIPQMPRVEWV